MNRKSARRSTSGVKVFVASASLAATVGGWAALTAANAGQLPTMNVPTANASGFGQSSPDDQAPDNSSNDDNPFSTSPSLNQPQPSNPNIQQTAPNQFNNSFPQPFRRTHSSR